MFWGHLNWNIAMAHTAVNLEPQPADTSTFSGEFKDYHPLAHPGEIDGYHSDQDADPSGKLLTEESKSESTKPASWIAFLSLEYYQSFFDVTTAEVFYRLLAGMVPFRFSLADSVSKKPDLYGPFWVCMTLIFTAALSGNIGKFFRSGVAWQFHFREVTLLGTALYTYICLVPLVLWLALWWRGNQKRYSFLQILCIYGYSVGVFIPIMFLWVISIDWLQWLLLSVGAVVSGASLVLTLWTPLQAEPKQVAIGVLCILFVLHAGLAVGFKFYYFSALSPNGTRIGN